MLTQLTEYHRPDKMSQASRLLARRDVVTAPLAGGTWLMAQRDLAVEAVIDLSALGLDFVKVSARRLRLGAMLTLQSTMMHPDIQRWANGLLSQAAFRSASRSIRNIATLGGTLAVGGPTAPINLALLALGAEVTIRMPAARTAPLHVLFADRSTYLPPHALITEIALPQLPANPGTAYAAVSRTPDDQPIVNAAAIVTRVGHICHHSRLALGGVATYPLLIPRVESLLLGCQIEEHLLARVAEAIAEAVDPLTDSRASADYRREMAAVVGARALREAWEQTGRSPV